MLTKTSEYALRSLVYLALHADTTHKIGIKEIAKELELPMHFTGKILQDLVRKGLIDSTKGPHGGFFLNSPANTIPIMDVVRLIDGTEFFKRCGLGLKHCSDSHPCPLHNDFKVYREGLAKLFSKKTIQDFVDEIENGKAFITNEFEKTEGEMKALRA